MDQALNGKSLKIYFSDIAVKLRLLDINTEVTMLFWQYPTKRILLFNRSFSRFFQIELTADTDVSDRLVP